MTTNDTMTVVMLTASAVEQWPTNMVRRVCNLRQAFLVRGNAGRPHQAVVERWTHRRLELSDAVPHLQPQEEQQVTFNPRHILQYVTGRVPDGRDADRATVRFARHFGILPP